MQSLTARYGRKSLHAIYGQAPVVESLRAFLQNPHSHVFLMVGGTGCGKTASAHALAWELGIKPEDDDLDDLRGFHQIASGELTVDNLRDHWGKFDLRPWSNYNATGWRMLLCNEVEQLHPKVELRFLDLLEALPGKAVVCFTTNDTGKLSQRFLDRCEVHQFASSASTLRDSIRRACVQIWRAEGMTGEPPGLATMGIQGATASFRAAYRALEVAIRTAKGNQQKRAA
jgi:replication-associated recombination protein RarA